MSIDETRSPPPRRIPAQPPAFNVPGIVLAMLVLLTVVHVARTYLIGPILDERFVADAAFIPACYSQPCELIFGRPAGALLWAPLTHALIHGDWTHLGLNSVWLLAFGSPVARRIGSGRFLAFSVGGAIAGAAAFFALNPVLMEPVIGASGVVTALMGGACRFAFAGLSRRSPGMGWTPRLSIGQALTDRTILFFIAVFFATNLLTATSLGGYVSGGAQIAWEAHIGGFLFGFLAFALFDRGPAPGRPPASPVA
ncbi:MULTISPECIES: rhomboid family intramembrane serine protease [unclassified Aureimonas]|uniref:rhomboid family intramembrane serine protease n=1 Tax=unclassified Aureimonas TaxID=2615206 RepID=UPI0006FB2E12|nr:MULTISPECIES: rhomboid family intramembrane serine protease [unclassified Aureimonas]KQT57592.1 protease [Aureimonas sp. Leaf427]KQT77201.1 protease [Aureimonas sp. Leaf460]